MFLALFMGRSSCPLMPRPVTPRQAIELPLQGQVRSRRYDIINNNGNVTCPNNNHMVIAFITASRPDGERRRPLTPLLSAIRGRFLPLLHPR